MKEIHHLHLKLTRRDYLLLLLVPVLLLPLAIFFPPAATLVLSVVILLLILLEFFRRIQFQLSQMQLRQYEDYRQMEAFVSLIDHLQPEFPLPAMRSWAVSPDMALLLLHRIYERQPLSILECGSGLSTLIMAKALHKLGKGRIYALEHDEIQCQRTETLLRLHGLESIAQVVHAPLLLQPKLESEWYDLSRLPEHPPIDLLFIDGPPQKAGSCSRYPSLPLLLPRLADNVEILLDDAGRSPEQSSLKRWEKEYPEFQSEYIATEYGSWIFRRRA